MLPSETPSKINRAALGVVAGLLDALGQRLGPDCGHVHISLTSESRLTEAGDLRECEIAYDLTVCPRQSCGEPDDGGVRAWNAWRRGKRLAGLESIESRSDEVMAAAAIWTLCEPRSITKLPERAGRRTPDFMVTLADGRRAAVEVTMHTDAGRRELLSWGERFARSTLVNRWRAVAFDNRHLESYDDANGFSANDLQRALAGTLRRVEANGGELDDYEHISDLCERQIARIWSCAENETLQGEPPIRLAIIDREPAETGQGGVSLAIAPITFNFHAVVEVSDLAGALQARIDKKRDHDQWGDIDADERWLMIVLDGGAATNQLMGSFDIDDHKHDFGAVAFPGIDEVWAIAFGDEKLTVLRFAGSHAHWEHHPQIPVQTL